MSLYIRDVCPEKNSPASPDKLNWLLIYYLVKKKSLWPIPYP